MVVQSVWGGVLPVYLFFGGLGGSVLFVAALLDFVNVKRYRRVVRVSAWSSVAFFAIGALLLLYDVRVPLRALRLWESFTNFDSWLTIGAWTLLMAGVCAMAFASVSCVSQEGFAIRRVLAALCLPAGFSMTAYTGILLMTANAIPAWSTVLVPILFVASAFSSGIAYTMVIFKLLSSRKLARRTMGWDSAALVCALIEAMVLFLYVAWLLATSDQTLPSARLLLNEYFPPFWSLVVLCGIVVPFGHASFVLAFRFDGKIVATLSTLCALSGGLALRFLVLAIGMRVPVALV